ncbi:MAG TPA: alpha/beta hydrolase, partial [Dehalococcoidia bacterium]|nr:alpha/beta hydrolase [Dehalococcoidia bacterium]
VIVGHSFGGAVAISAAARDRRIAAVVGLSNQTAGAQPVGRIAPRPLLLVHGLDDDRLPPSLSRTIYAWAGEPKGLVLLAGARHSLRQRREDLRAILIRWLTEALRAPRQP